MDAEPPHPPSPSSRPARRGLGRVLLVASVAALTLGWVASMVELQGVWTHLERFDPLAMIGLVVLYVALLGMRARRAQLLVPSGPGLRTWVPVVAVGFLASVVVPLRLGILVRPWLLERASGVPFGVGAAGAVAERVIDLAVLLVLVAVVVAGLGPPGGALEALPELRVGVVLVAVAALGGLAGLGWIGPESMARWLAPAARWGRPAAAVVAVLTSFARGLSEMGAHPRRTVGALVWTGWMWLAGMVAAALIFSGFPGLGVSVERVVAFWTAVIGAAAAVPTPAAVGPFEAAGVATLSAYGVEPDLALAATATMHVGMFTTNATLGALALWWTDLSLRPGTGTEGERPTRG